ncbi:MAG: hypothetical protein WA615_28280 [Bradyrhizobium sp.]|jgi:hypothetical protein|uniref:hypothetical protein n=1 Tax=Bradyrhizobium sp. TaxID=376 RepID=UPI003C7DB258
MELAFGRKKENQPAEQKGHTTDYHRNANRIHVESSKEYRSGSFEDRKRRIRNCRPFILAGFFVSDVAAGYDLQPFRAVAGRSVLEPAGRG